MFKTFQGIPFSILELALVNENGDIKTALENSLNLAQHAEKWGYHRFWLAEHHNMPGVASSATSVSDRLYRGEYETDPCRFRRNHAA